MTEPEFDAELIRKYDRAGPRYTSYPTAVQFSTKFGADSWREAVSRSSREAPHSPLSLYVHIPFCSSPCFYCACNRIITRSEDRALSYFERLYREAELQAALVPRTRVVEQLHFGGGTPTFAGVSQLGRLMEQLARHFSLSSGAGREYSIEIDPRTVSAADVKELAALGFNRMSLGVQDFDAAVQQAIHRVQSVEETLRAVEAARAAGVGSLSFDLIYGLPRQTLEGFGRTLDTVIEARPERLAVYAYAHMPHVFKAQRRLNAQDLPPPALRLELLGLAIRKLTGAGYEYIGMDHFALPTDELVSAKRQGTLQRNFQGYSTHADCDLIGLGVTAIGKTERSYAQNQKDLRAYCAAIDAGQLAIHRGVQLTDDDLVRRAVIQQLMCHERVDCAGIGYEFGIDFKRYFRRELEELQRLQADGLIYVRNNTFGLTEVGRLLMRNVAMVFDAYLSPAHIYSKAI